MDDNFDIYMKLEANLKILNHIILTPKTMHLKKLTYRLKLQS
jgi:hypothetical protein